jgi:hypothetical protein
MTRTKTAIANRTTSASRPSSENPTKAIDGKREPSRPARRPHHWRGERRRIGALMRVMSSTKAFAGQAAP